MKRYDMIVRNARLRARSGPLDLAIQGGFVAEIGERIEADADRQLDASGGLLTESFVNPHLHLDKVFTLARLDERAMRDYQASGMGTAMRAIERAAGVKSQYQTDWILENVERALGHAIQFGNTHIRAFADVDSKARLIGVRALLEARERYAGRVAIQVVAFPQDGVIREPGTRELIEEAARMGVDVIGGIPWIEYTDEDARAHIRQMFEIAKDYDLPISMLVDDAGDAGLRTLEMLALESIQAGWQGRCVGHHARAMALYPEPYFQKLVGLLRQADVAIVSDPHTGPLHARLGDLREAGITVSIGQDDISDAYYPYGRNNMLEVAFLSSHLLWMTTEEDMRILYDMITVEAARTIGVQQFSIEVGAAANLVILEQETELEALRWHEAPRVVIFNGRIIKG